MGICFYFYFFYFGLCCAMIVKQKKGKNTIGCLQNGTWYIGRAYKCDIRLFLDAFMTFNFSYFAFPCSPIPSPSLSLRFPSAPIFNLVFFSTGYLLVHFHAFIVFVHRKITIFFCSRTEQWTIAILPSKIKQKLLHKLTSKGIFFSRNELRWARKQ